VMDVLDGGMIVGGVIFVGSIPRLPPLSLLKDKELCAAAASPQMLLVSGENGGVKNAVISVEGITRGKAPPSYKPILDNRDCMMTPRVLAVMAGTEIVIQNSDPFLHTMRGRLPDFRQAFNLVFPKGTPAKEQKLRFPGLISVTCDTHPHMLAYIHAFDHPYSAVTDARGHFEIAQVPPGRYTITAWHGAWNILGYDGDGRPRYDAPHILTAVITVRAGETSSVEFRLPAHH